LTHSDAFQFNLPTRVRFGEGELRALPGEAAALGMTRPLLVTDATLVQTPHLQRTVADCRAAGLALETWDGVVPNPTDTSVHEGLALYRSSGRDGLIGYGGGSAIDSAKAIGVMASSGGDNILNYVLPDPLPILPLPPLIAVPTTAGTGSEATWVSIVTSSVTGRKTVIRNPALFPAVSIVDPALTHSMPAGLTVNTGFDAFSHAVETYTSGMRAPVSDPLAYRSMGMIVAALPRAVRDGVDAEARNQMSLAATMAGIAFTNGGLHSGHHISHILTSRYHLPHGLACILTIPAMLAYIRPVCMEKVASLAPLFGAPPGLSPEEASVWAAGELRALMDAVGVPTIEEATGDTPEAIPGLVAGIVAHGPNPFSPRPMDAEGYTWILERTFDTGAPFSDWPEE
jgi:alcohol dehydrogenase